MTDRKHDASQSGDDLERDLAAMGEIEREMMRGARSGDSVPGLERVEATLRAAMSQSDARRIHPGRRRSFAIAALIAASLAIGAVWLYMTRNQPIPEQPLGNQIEILESELGVDPFSRVRWNYPAVPGVRFEVRVLAATEDPIAGDSLLFRKSELRERVFQFPNEESNRWPARIIIVVGVLGADDTFTSPSRVSRSRP